MISVDRAREIASWYQSPGTEGRRFAEFASTGIVSDFEGLLADIEREGKNTDNQEESMHLDQLENFLIVWLDEL